MLDGIGFLLVMFSILCFLVSVILSLGMIFVERSKKSLYRIAINALICALFFPTGHLGGYLRDKIFLMHLARFQEVTDLLIRNAGDKLNADDSRAGARLPPGYSNLHVADYVLLHSTHGNITVIYTSRDSSAVGHRGYVYRSDDDPAACQRDTPKMWCKRLAPHWFYYVD